MEPMSKEEPASSVVEETEEIPSPVSEVQISFSEKRKPNRTIKKTKIKSHLVNVSKPRQIDAFTAAEACELFGREGKGGGQAFARWCKAKGWDSDVVMSATEWRPLLEEFAKRPLHGHRRTAQGGNHRPNKKDIR